MIQAIKAGSQDAFSALALSLVPNISSLIIGEHSLRYRSKFVVPLITRAGARYRLGHKSPLFRSLKQLTGCTEQCKLNFLPDPQAFESFFWLPQLETLSATIHEPESFVWSEHTCPRSTIKNLTLRFSELRPRNLRVVLSALPSLEKFAYSHVVFLDPIEPVPPSAMEIDVSDWEHKYRHFYRSSPPGLNDVVPAAFNLSDFIVALLPVSPTLKSLTFRLETTYHYSATHFLERQEDLIRGSLRGLNALHNLEILDMPNHLFMEGDGDLGNTLNLQSLRTLYVGHWTAASGYQMTDVEYLVYLAHFLIHDPRGRPLHIGIVDAFQVRNKKTSEQILLKHIRFCKENHLSFSVHSDEPRNTMRRYSSDDWVPSFNPQLRGLAQVEAWWLEKILKHLEADLAWQQGMRHVDIRDRQLFWYAAGLNLSHHGWQYVESDRAFERLER